VADFLGSESYRRGVVNQLYTHYLRRPAAPSEAALLSGKPAADAAAAITGSREYFERANGGGALAHASISSRGRVRLDLRRASEIRIGVIRSGARIGTVRLGRHARGLSIANWNRRRVSGVVSVIIEAWSHGRMIDATDPIAVTLR
jgi:hypothetical protein